MRERLEKYFTRSVLNESAFKNIVAINDSDMNFLKTLGLYIYEGFRRDITEDLADASGSSYLFDQLKRESRSYLKGTESIYWNQKTYKEGKDPAGIHVVSVSSDAMNRSKGCILSKFYEENRALIYLPVLEDWTNYYLKTCKEGLDRKLLLSYIIEPLKEIRGRKLCIYNSSAGELVEIIRR